MPNWTNNRIVIKGLKEDLDKFLNDANKGEGGYYSFNSWIPQPKTFADYDTTNYPYGKGMEVGKHLTFEKNSPIITEELIEEYKKVSEEQERIYGVVGWRAWRTANWGTKWNEELEIEFQNDERIDFVCETAWFSPKAFCLTISEMYKLEIWLYAHYEDAANEAYYFYEGNAADITEDLTGQIVRAARENFANNLDKEDLKLFNEWIDYNLYDMAYLSKFVEDDNTDDDGAIEECFKEYKEWELENERAREEGWNYDDE